METRGLMFTVHEINSDFCGFWAGAGSEILVPVTVISATVLEKSPPILEVRSPFDLTLPIGISRKQRYHRINALVPAPNMAFSSRCQRLRTVLALKLTLPISRCVRDLHL
jgi:hypothetical protein